MCTVAGRNVNTRRKTDSICVPKQISAVSIYVQVGDYSRPPVKVQVMSQTCLDTSVTTNADHCVCFHISVLLAMQYLIASNNF
jgi:hypothetical protein